MAGKTRIAQFLKARGATQAETASNMGISMQALSEKANGRRQFKANEIKKIAEMYDMDANEIKNVFL